jgi:hypothetical protein
MARRFLGWLLAAVVLAGCQSAAGPPTDPDGLQREADKVKKEAEREWENK